MRKTADGTTTQFVWDGDVLLHELVAEADGEPSAEPVTWVFDPERFSPAARLGPEGSHSVVTDHLGSPCACSTSRAARPGRAAWTRGAG